MRPTCISCDAPLRWVKSANGKPMPLNREPAEKDDPRGVIAIETNLFGDTVGLVVGPTHGTHISHFATCPNADTHRRPRRRKRHTTP